MSDIKLDYDDEPFRKLGRHDRIIARTVAESLNRFAKLGEGEAVERITDEVMLDEGYVRKRFFLGRATPERTEATINVRRRPVQVRQFGAQQEFTAASGAGVKRAGISVHILRGGARKIIKNAFFARLKQGGIGVFGRKGKDRYPIKALYAVSPDQMFVRYTPEMSDDLLERLADDLDRQLSRSF